VPSALITQMLESEKAILPFSPGKVARAGDPSVSRNAAQARAASRNRRRAHIAKSPSITPRVAFTPPPLLSSV
jgi:hypothetical protein